MSEPAAYNCPKHRTNDHAEGSLLCWSQVSSYYSNQAKPSDILDQVEWYCSEHQTSYSNCEKWKLQHRMDRPSGVDVNSQPYRKDEVIDKLNDQRLDSASIQNFSFPPAVEQTLDSELPRTYALGIQIIGDTHDRRCSTTHSLERCPLLKLWLKMVGFEDPK